MAEELKHILDAEQIEKTVLIGQSMGGYVAQSFLMRYPERVKAFVSIDSTPYGSGYYTKADLWWLRQIEWMARIFPDRILRRSMAMMCGTTPKARENMMKMLADYPKKELCHLMYLGYADLIPELRDMEIQCPVCLLLGDKDRLGKVKQYNLQWARQTGYPLYIIENAAHNANEDNPTQANAVIQEFLEKLQ